MADKDDEQKQLIMDFQNAFTSEGGKRVFAKLIKETKADFCIVPHDNLGRIDAFEIMRNEGRRSVIVYIRRMLKKDPYQEIQKVAKG